MNQFLFGLDNREIALLAWAGILLGWILSVKDLRNRFLEIMKNLFLSKLTMIFVLTTGYSTIIYYFLYRYNFWEKGLLKEGIICLVTIGFWGVGTAISKIKTLKHSLKLMALESIKIIVLIQFLTGFYVMNLFLELLLVPIAIILGMLQAMSFIKQKTESKYILTTKVINWITSLLGLSILAYSMYQFKYKPEELLTMFNLKELLLPIIMTLAYFPLLYLMGIYTSYESFYLRLKFLLRNNSILSYAKMKILLKCNLNIETLNKVQYQIIMVDIYTKEDLNQFLRRV